MNNQNFSRFLNRGISTSVGIFIIVLVAVIAGGIYSLAVWMDVRRIKWD
ncbi:MAG: hypothetical protein WBC21_03830 [Minisyncoccales bacterium]